MDNNQTINEIEAKENRKRERKNRRNARVARGRFIKNLFIWLLGVLFIPSALVLGTIIVPLKTITGNDGAYVSTELSNKSLFEVVKTVATDSGAYGFSDFPIIAQKLGELKNTEIFDGKTLGDIVNIDTDRLNTLKFGNENLAGEIQSCVEVVATIESVGGADILGDFGTLNVFTDEEAVCTVSEVGAGGTLDNTAEDFDAKQYYYKTTELDATATLAYKRAFNDDKSLVSEVSELSDEKKATVHIYYPPLEKVKLSELINIFGGAFGRLEINSLLGTFGASNETLTEILGEHTKIKDLSDFDVNTVKLTSVLGEYDESTKDLYDILSDATNGTLPEDITIGDLTDADFSINNIKLERVLEKITDTSNPDYGKNHQLWEILEAAITPANADGVIRVSDFSSFDAYEIKLTTVLPESGNEKLYKVLKDLTGENSENIKISHMNGLDTDDMHLKIILEYEGNEKLFEILLDGIPASWGISDPEDITIGSMSYFDPDRIHLSTVVGTPDNNIVQALVDKNATLGTLGAVIKDLEITDIFDVKELCFIADDDPDVNTKVSEIDLAKGTKYKKTGDTYTLAADGTYYISKEAHAWLFILFDGNGVISSDPDANGSIGTYSLQTIKLYGSGAGDVSMQDRMTAISSSLMNATIRQLVQAGILTESPAGQYSPLYGQTFTQILNGSLVP